MKKGFLYEAIVHYSVGEVEDLLEKGETLTVKVPDNAFDIGAILNLPGGNQNKMTVTMYVTHIPSDIGGATGYTRTIYMDPAKALRENNVLMWSPTEIREMS